MKKPILIIQNCPVESAGTILDWLNDRALPYSVVHIYRDQELPALESVEAVVCLGCPHSAVVYYEHEYLKRLYAFVTRLVRADIPYLGICFGGQLLAAVLGARVERNGAREIGSFDVSLTDDGAADPLFDGFPTAFPVFQWHNDTFRTPFGGSHLVTGDKWQHQAFRKDRQVGLQFHLEARPDEIPRWCDAYADELKAIGQTKSQLVDNYRAVADPVKALNFRLLDNWLG